jgi:Raf kinase inhibitor-like YbhB/YbcL family protein
MRGVWLVFLPCALGSLILTSPDFLDFEDIPMDFACSPYHQDQLIGPSPPLKWFRPPEKTRSFLLVVDDIDSDGHVHWLVSNIPPDVFELEKDASRYSMPPGATETWNTFGDIGFGSFCSINAQHTFRFRLFALRVPKFEFRSYHRFMNDFPITLEKVETQLQAIEADIIYVATLAGKQTVPYDPQAPPPPEPSPPPYVPVMGPIPQIRYVKPSETLKNQRPHNSPRPMINTTVEDVCARYNAQNRMSRVYAQLCRAKVDSKVMQHRIQKFIDGGGEEAPVAGALPARHVNLLQPKGSLAQAEVEEPAAAEEEKKAKDAKADVDETALLVDWDCADKELDHEKNNPLRLRSPVVDTCGVPSTATPVMPAEFTCDRTNPSLTRASPPLMWRLAAQPDAKCQVNSYVVMLEDVKTAKINWLVSDIPASQTELEVGMSGEQSNVHGVEHLNSHKTESFVAPCVEGKDPQLYRFHLFAMPGHHSALAKTDVMLAAGVHTSLGDACYSTHMDFAAVKAQ